MSQSMLTALVYRNPRLLILMVSLIVVSGLSSYVVLPRMEDPLLTPRAAIVNTRFPGADAARVESLVTEKIEEELQEIEEIKELRSTSRPGISTISIELRDDVYESAEVWSRIRDKIDDAAVLLPGEASDPEFDDLEVKAYALIAAVTWRKADAPNFAVLRRIAESLEDRLRAITGTEEVDTFGDPDEEIIVEIDPSALASRGLTVADVSRRIRASDAKIASGQMRTGRGDVLLEVDSELDSLARVAQTPLKSGADGSLIQLADVAQVRKGITDPPSSLALVAGRPAIALGALVRADHRVDHWNHDAAHAIEEFRGTLPQGVDLEVVFEQNRYVETRLQGLLRNLLLGGLAVVGVTFFLMGWRRAVVVGATLPLAAMMVLTGMRALGIPVHQMSITGLIIALGLLIDNAIVIVDEVGARLRAGLRPEQAVSHSVGHLAVPLFGSTLTTALAFAPIALMPGPAGEFVGSIAVSVILAIASSFLLAMTVIPAVTALILPSPGPMPADPLADAWWRVGWSHARLAEQYRRFLGVVLRTPLIGILFAVALPLWGLYQAGKLPEQFFPPADRDQIQIELELASHASLAETLDTAKEIRNVVLGHDGVSQVHWFLGESAPSFYYNLITRRANTAHYAQALVQLSSPEGSQSLIHELQRELDSQFSQARVVVRQLEQGPPFDAPVEVRLFGPDIERLRVLGDKVRAHLAVLPHVVHTRSELSEVTPKIGIAVDEEQARLAGLDHEEIARQLNANLEGAVGGSILEATEELPVRVRVSNLARGDLSQIASLDVLPGAPTAGDYPAVPLSSLARVAWQPEIAAIPHMNARRMNEVQAFITAGVLPAQVLADFEARLRQSGFSLPAGYDLEFGGEAAKRDEAIGNLMASVGVLAVMMVATLVLSFRSFRISVIIVTVAALSVGLGTGALWLFGYPFGFMAIVGTMGLIGVAINDSIVVLAAIRENERARDGDAVAMRDVVLRSTRHVVATSLTTMAGFTPLVLGGGGFWPPMAVAIAGGVGGATLLALVFVPAAYVLAMCGGRCKMLSALDRQTTPETHVGSLAREATVALEPVAAAWVETPLPTSSAAEH